MGVDGFVEWPEQLAERYRTEGFWSGELLYDVVASSLRADPAALVLTDEHAALTRTELLSAVEARAAGLSQAGLSAGDSVVLQLNNNNDFVVTFLALLAVGCRPVLALPGHRRSELTHVAGLSEAKAIAIPGEGDGPIDFGALAAEVCELVPSLDMVLVEGHILDGHDIDIDGGKPEPLATRPNDIALFLLSGGTTGLPKLIARTNDDYVYNIRTSAAVSGFGPDTVYLVALPAGHNFPLGCPGFLGAILSGGRVVMSKSPATHRAFPLIETEKVTAAAAVPAVAIQWMDDIAEHPGALDSLELLQVGGSKLIPEAARRVKPTLGCQLQQVFGMAEGLLNYTRLDDPDDVVVLTQGRPMSPADEVRIVDEAGAPVEEGEVGELLTAGPYTLRGYFRAPEHNERSFTPDGFYRSGDLVRRHSSGNLIVEGRAKDHINRGGEKISAEEVEDHAIAHPAVFNAAAVGVADERLGERIGLFVTATTDLELDDLREHFAARGVATFKAPERLYKVDDFPVTNVGKIDKAALRRRAAEAEADN